MAIPNEFDIQGHKVVALFFIYEKDGIFVILIHGITASIHFWEPSAQRTDKKIKEALYETNRNHSAW